MTVENKTTSRPSPLTIGVALLVIVASVALIWLGIMYLTAYAYQRDELVGSICMAAGTIIGACQFLGTFRRRPVALVLAIVGLAGAGWLSVGGAVLFYGIGRQFPGDEGELVAICGSIGLAGSVALGCAWANLKWHRQMLSDRLPPLPLWQFSFRELLFAITLLAVVLGCVGYRFRGAFERNWAINVPPTAAPFDVPLTGKDVCHGWNGTLQAVEFTISESEFVAWVKRRGREHHSRWRTPLAEITSSYEVVTYRFLRGDDATQGLAVVDNGLFLELDDGYGSLQVAYDRDKSRAYACEDLRFGFRPEEPENDSRADD